MSPLRRRDLDVLTAAVHPEGDPAQLVDPDRGDGPARRDVGDDAGHRHWLGGDAHLSPFLPEHYACGCGTGIRDSHPTRPAVLAAAGADVHGHRRGEPARHRWRGGGHQPHQLLRLHLRGPARLQAAPRPQGAVHGEERGLRPQDHRPAHAQPAPHRGGPRQRLGFLRAGLPEAQGRRTSRRLP